MGRAWANNINKSSQCDIAGWIDVREGAAATASAEMNLAVPYSGNNLADALRDVQPDFVVDVTPPEVHCSVTVEALAAGIPVLGEKPMASSMSEARRMISASESAGKLYMVSQSRRYDAGLWAFRKVIEEKLGGAGVLNADFYIGAHFGGFRDEMPSPLVLDMAIHTFDESRFLSGTDPVAVYAEEFNPGWSWYKGDACASAIFEMSGGLRFTYRGSWCAEGLHTSWDADWRAVGPRGSAIWKNNELPVSQTITRKAGFFSECEEQTEPTEEIASGIAGSLTEFIEAIQTGRMPNGECHDNIKSLAMVFAAIESSKRKERVLIEEILLS